MRTCTSTGPARLPDGSNLRTGAIDYVLKDASKLRVELQRVLGDFGGARGPTLEGASREDELKRTDNGY